MAGSPPGLTLAVDRFQGAPDPERSGPVPPSPGIGKHDPVVLKRKLIHAPPRRAVFSARTWLSYDPLLGSALHDDAFGSKVGVEKGSGNSVQEVPRSVPLENGGRIAERPASVASRPDE